MEFETAFDVVQSGYRYWWLPAVALLPLGAGALMAFAPRLAQRVLGSHVRGRLARFFGVVFFAFALGWAILVFMNTWNDHRFYRDALLRGEYKTVEGVVENFRPLAAHGYGGESFAVNGVAFHYSPTTFAPGYNRARADGGAIAAGAYVRIAYVNLVILKLEVAKR